MKKTNKLQYLIELISKKLHDSERNQQFDSSWKHRFLLPNIIFFKNMFENMFSSLSMLTSVHWSWHILFREWKKFCFWNFEIKKISFSWVVIAAAVTVVVVVIKHPTTIDCLESSSVYKITQNKIHFMYMLLLFYFSLSLFY